MLLQIATLHSFLGLSTIPSYIYATHHIFFTRSSVDGYLSCFLVAIVNNAIMSIWCLYLFKLEFLSHEIPI